MTPPEMARIHREAFVTVPRPWTTAEFEAMIAKTDTVALTDPHGFLIARVDTNEAEILTIAVDPERHRQGIGTRILAAFLKSQSNRRVILDVAATNIPAQKLYTNAGFTEVGRRPRYYRFPDGTRADALVMAFVAPS